MGQFHLSAVNSESHSNNNTNSTPPAEPTTLHNTVNESVLHGEHNTNIERGQATNQLPGRAPLHDSTNVNDAASNAHTEAKTEVEIVEKEPSVVYPTTKNHSNYSDVEVINLISDDEPEAIDENSDPKPTDATCEMTNSLETEELKSTTEDVHLNRVVQTFNSATGEATYTLEPAESTSDVHENAGKSNGVTIPQKSNSGLSESVPNELNRSESKAAAAEINETSEPGGAAVDEITAEVERAVELGVATVKNTTFQMNEIVEPRVIAMKESATEIKRGVEPNVAAMKGTTTDKEMMAESNGAVVKETVTEMKESVKPNVCVDAATEMENIDEPNSCENTLTEMEDIDEPNVCIDAASEMENIDDPNVCVDPAPEIENIDEPNGCVDAATEMENIDQPNVEKTQNTSPSRADTKAEDEPVSTFNNTPSIQAKDNPDVKVENSPATTNRDVLVTSFIPITETESEVPHWECAKVPNSQKCLLGKARRKRLRHYRFKREGSSDVGSDNDRPFRPSDIVKGDEEYSDVDYEGENRKRHRRRIAATVLKTQNLTSDRQLVSHSSELARYKLKNYGCFLSVPPTDRNIVKNKPYHKYLSRKMIRKRRRKRRCVYQLVEHDLDGESPPSCGGLRSDSDFFELIPLETAPKMHMGYELLSQTDEMKSSRTTIMSFGQNKRAVNERAKPLKKRPKKSELLSDFCNMMKFNPSALFADIDERKMKAAANDGKGGNVINVDEEAEKKEKVIDVDKDSDSDFSSDEDQTMLVFDKMKRDAIEKFYKTRKVRVRKKSKERPNDEPIIVDWNAHRKKNKDKGKSRNSTTNKSGSEYLLRNPMVAQYMKKYNYAGRLGKHGQGITEYIQPWNVSWGAGLGAQAKSSAFRIESQSNSNHRKSMAQPEKQLIESERSDATSRKRKSLVHSPQRQSLSCAISDDSIIYLGDDGFRTLPPDNGRRAMLVDFDTLFTNSHNRRIDAFIRVIRKSPEISSVPDASVINTEMFSTRGDLCDREYMELLLSKFNIPRTFLYDFLERLDDAFEKCTPLTLDHLFVMKLRDYSSFVRLGIFHIGTNRRMNRELQRSGLSDKLVSSAVISVYPNDRAPYVQSFRELFLRIGVSPCQSILIVPDRLNSQNFICSGVVAARVMGARSLVQIGKRPGELPSQGRQNPFQATLAINDNLLRGPRVMLNFTLNQQFRIRKKHILAQNPKDNLWHSAVEIFRPKCANNGVVQVYIRYDEDGELNWCNSDLMHKLDQRNYEKMKDNDFPALIDFSSIEMLETNRSKRRRIV